MIIASASQFHVCLPWVNVPLAKCLNRVLNVKALVGAFNQEKALVGAFSVIMITLRWFVWSSTWRVTWHDMVWRQAEDIWPVVTPTPRYGHQHQHQQRAVTTFFSKTLFVGRSFKTFLNENPLIFIPNRVLDPYSNSRRVGQRKFSLISNSITGHLKSRGNIDIC